MGISSYSTTPGSNTAINGINIAEGCAPSGINDAIRQLMADIATGFSPAQIPTATGTANAITVTLAPAQTSWVAGQRYTFIPSLSNTSNTVTINHGGGAKNILKWTGVPLAVNDIVASMPVEVIYDGTQVFLLNPQTHVQGADLASSSSINLSTVTGDYVNITGTTAISGVVLRQGLQRTVKFSGVLNLVNSGSLILPGGADISTAAGDIAVFRGEALSIVRCISYTKASGAPVVGGTTATTQSTHNNSTSIATTAYTDRAAYQIEQNSKSAAYTTVLADAGQHIYHPSTDNNARTFTIDSNANVAYPIGTCITFINEINTVTISITSDTLVLAGSGSTGSRTLAANGIATAIKVGTTRWFISGTGLT